MSVLVETAERKRQRPWSWSSVWKKSLLNLPPSHPLCSHPELAGWGPYSTKRAGNRDIGEPGPPGRRRVTWRRRSAELRGHLQSCGGTLGVRRQGSAGSAGRLAPAGCWEELWSLVGGEGGTGRGIMTVSLAEHGQPLPLALRGWDWRQLWSLAVWPWEGCLISLG